MNFYTGQFIEDADGDGVADIVAVHGGDPFAPPGWYRHDTASTPFVEMCITHCTRCTHVYDTLYHFTTYSCGQDASVTCNDIPITATVSF